MRFPKQKVEEEAREFIRACESSPTPLVFVPLIYNGYQLLKTYWNLRRK